MLKSLLSRTKRPAQPSAPKEAPTGTTLWTLFRGPILALVITLAFTVVGLRLVATPVEIAEKQDELLRGFENTLLPLQTALAQFAQGRPTAAKLQTLAQQQSERLTQFHATITELQGTIAFGLWTQLGGNRQPEIGQGVETLDRLWQQARREIDTLTTASQSTERFRELVTTVDQAAQTVVTHATTLSSQVDARAAANQALMLAVTAQRLAQNATRLLSAAPAERETLLFALENGNGLLTKTLRTIDPALSAHPLFPTIKNEAETIASAVNSLLDAAPTYFAQWDSATILQQLIPQLQERVGALYNLIEQELETGRSASNLVLMLAGIALVGIFVQLVKNYLDLQKAQQAKEQAERQRLENEGRRTQEAILRLLNEMADLAEGDLTIRATVTEDITGAIADSVNFAVEELGNLVRRINETAESLAEAASESNERVEVQRLLSAEQSQEIESAEQNVQEVAQALTRAADEATEAAQAARRSLEASQKGTVAVNQTVEGMDRIREQIQETAKRIKRLGESSQEIGEIVELISDITEQTNVLALNAAIQAAAAGEAGRGFSVVAEEVQRLAERSAEATKRIAAIIRTIQTDTQETVAAMEATTQEVVAGAALSEEARRALEEIAKTSRETAAQIARVTQAIQTQAQRGEEIARLMHGVLTLTQTTREGTEQTAEQIARLADLAAELRGSVAGFRI
ncbi:chemotaxis chemoreceptor PilJ [Hydrogenophilus islandicus]